jgi:hypothetical protein
MVGGGAQAVWRIGIQVGEFGGCSLLTGRLVWLPHSHFQMKSACFTEVYGWRNNVPFAEHTDESNAPATVGRAIEIELARASNQEKAVRRV